MKLTLPLTLLLTCGVLFSSTGMIRGKVTSAEGNPLPEANIVIINTTLGSASDEDGKFIIRGIKPGTYILQCSFVGYRNAIRRNITVTANRFTEVDFVLTPIDIRLQTIEVEREKEDVMSIISTRELILPTVFETFEIEKPSFTGDINVNTRVGFWERFRHFFRRKS